MSGRKESYTTVTTSELRRLRQQASRAASLEQSVSAMNRLADRTQTYLNQQERRIDGLNRTITSLNHRLETQTAAMTKERQQVREEMRRIVQDTNTALRQMNEDHRHDMETLDNRFRQSLQEEHQETVRMLEASQQQMTDALNQAVTQLETSIGTVSHRVDAVENSLHDIVQSDAALLEFARGYLDTAADLNSDTAEHFRTELLLPGRLAEAQAAADHAREEIQTAEKYPTNASVARQSAREAAEAALRLHQDIVVAEQAWQASLAEASRAAAAAEAQCTACQTVNFPDTDVAVEVDRWSNGTLQTLQTRTQAITAQLNNPDSLTAEQLDDLHDAAAQITAEAVDAAAFAVIAFSASQDRADVAQDLFDELHDRLGLQCAFDCYEGNDQRAAHRVHLKNPETGFEMVITQTPQTTADGAICNRLETDILDYGTNNQTDGDAIAREALANLSQLGLSVGNISTVPGYEAAPSDRSNLTVLADWQAAVPTVPCPPAAQNRPTVQGGNNQQQGGTVTPIARPVTSN